MNIGTEHRVLIEPPHGHEAASEMDAAVSAFRTEHNLGASNSERSAQLTPDE